MTHPIVDLRSDTVTKPTPAMREAMARAEVGDDVFGDDPTVNRLEERLAEMFGKEAALFVPSGTMANQLAIRVHSQPGDEIIAHEGSHIYHYESGAPAALSGCMLKLVPGERGIFTADDVRAAVRPTDDHFPRSSLVVVENTHNRGGGAVWSVDRIAEVRAAADEFGLRMHLDGARLMNACVARAIKPAEYAKHFDTVATCFSKGLGAPVGSAIIGDKQTITQAHRYRKMFGGGMRQVGIIAAGALYALEHHVERLAVDHANAKRLGEAVAELPGIVAEPVETNIVIFDVDASRGPALELCDRLRDRGIWMMAIGPQRVRAVTHLDVDGAGIERAIEALRLIVGAQ